MTPAGKPFLCVVDDDLEHGSLLSQALAGGGFDVRAFGSAAEFLRERHGLERCDLIISDIHMPGPSGFDLCRVIRADGTGGRLPVILMTGSDPQGEKAHGLDAGADDFVGKPCSIADLQAKIRSLLNIRAKELDSLRDIKQLRKFISPNVAHLLSTDERERLLRPHRAEVSILFVDLRGFTAFSERGEPEEVMEVLGAYYTAVGNAAMKYRGTLGHLAGDGIMIFFNDPEPVPDHPNVAIRMAVEARDALTVLRETWRERRYGIGFGMGISAGHATIGEIGFDRFAHYSVIGPSVNFAARLCSQAGDGQILVSRRFLARLGEGIWDAEAVGDLLLKGIERPVTALNILKLAP